MKMKKLLASALAAAMVVSSMVGAMVTSAATLTGTIAAGSVEVAAGATEVTVPVTIDFEGDVVSPHGMFTVSIAGAELTSAVLENAESYKVGETQNGNIYSLWIDADGVNNGTILVESLVDANAPTISENIVVDCTFSVPAGVNAELDVVVSDVSATNYGEDDWNLTATDGKITVKVVHEHEYTEVKYDENGHWTECACGESATEAVPHVWVDGERVDSTCTTAGSLVQNCDCGATQTVALDLAAHTPVVDAAVDATCTATGLTEGSHCDVCGAVIVAQEVVPMIDHAFNDGPTCGVCGAENPDYVAEVNINGVSRMKSLSLKDVIYVNPFVGFVEVKDGKNYNTTAVDKAFIVENGKILFWDTNPGDNAVIGTETAVSSVEYDSDYKDTNDAEKIHEYKGKSMGIPAKNFGDTIYYRTYIVIDGKEYYGDIIEYSVQTYCYNQINSSNTTEKQNKLRALCATMLNFGSAAQIQLKYNVDNLSNSILPGLVDAGKLDAKYLEQNWDESLLIPANTPATDMIVNFAQNDASITERTLQLKGAIEPKITMGYKIVSNKATVLPEGADLTFYFWTSEQYESLAAAGTPLSKDNASTTKTLGEFDENGVAEVELSYTNSYGYEYWAKPEPISARNLEKTFYFVAIVTEADGTEYCTGVNSYSPIQYAINQLAKATTTTNANLQDLCRWIVLYWDAAKAYLG